MTLLQLTRSLRFRVAAAAAIATAAALLGTGVFVVAGVNSSDRRTLDRTLITRVDQATTAATAALRGPAGPAPRLLGPADQRLGDEVAIVRVLRGGQVTERLGSIADPGLPATVGRAPETVEADGAPWRMVQRSVDGDLEIQAAAPLTSLTNRAERLRDRVIVAGLTGVIAALLVGSLLVGAALGGLGRLRRSAAGIASTADLSIRIDEADGPREIRELAATLNTMLARLERAERQRTEAFDATRRFAADAGHELRTPLATIGAGVQTLAHHPDMQAADRDAAFADVLAEHRRAVALLSALQELARGDAASGIETEPSDLVELVDEAIAAVRAVERDADIELRAPDAMWADVWAPGIRLAVENLVRNAVIHGGSRVVVSIQAGPAIVVDDDGPGIPDQERATVTERFARGRNVTAPGSGLGLSLAEQQAVLHHGRLVLQTSDLGGLRARLELGS